MGQPLTRLKLQMMKSVLLLAVMKRSGSRGRSSAVGGSVIGGLQSFYQSENERVRTRQIYEWKKTSEMLHSHGDE